VLDSDEGPAVETAVTVADDEDTLSSEIKQFFEPNLFLMMFFLVLNVMW